MKRTIICLLPYLVLFTGIAANTGAAQDRGLPRPPVNKEAEVDKDTHFYRLDLILKELNGEKLVNARNYSMWMKSGEVGRIDSGSDIPYVRGVSSDKQTTNIQYRSVGVSFQYEIDEVDDTPLLSMNVSIASVIPMEQGQTEEVQSPVFRNTHFDISGVLLTPGKTELISSIDDSNSTRRFQLEAKITRLR